MTDTQQMRFHKASHNISQTTQLNNLDQDLYLHIVQDTPATVRVSRAQTRSTGSVLLAALDRDTGHLSEKHTRAVKRKKRSHCDTRR